MKFCCLKREEVKQDGQILALLFSKSTSLRCRNCLSIKALIPDFYYQVWLCRKINARPIVRTNLQRFHDLFLKPLFADLVKCLFNFASLTTNSRSSICTWSIHWNEIGLILKVLLQFIGIKRKQMSMFKESREKVWRA